MKITYKKVEKAPDNGRKVMDELIIIDNSGTGQNYLDLFVVSSPNTVYDFTVYPETDHGRLSDLIQEILSATFAHAIDGIDENDRSDIINMLTIIGGKFAITERNGESIFKLVDSDDMSPEGKIFFKLMNGRVMYADMQSFDWDMQMKDIKSLYANCDNIMNLMRLTVTSDTVSRVDDDGNVIENSDKPTLEVVNDEINQFMTTQKLNIDYSMYESDNTTERERAMIKLIDMLTIMKEIVLVTTSLGAQRSVIEFYEKKNSDSEPETISDADVEVVKEG